MLRMPRAWENTSWAGWRIGQARHPSVGQVRGRGLMIGIELVKSQETREPNPEARNKVIEKAFQQGLLVLGCGESTRAPDAAFDHRAGTRGYGARNPRALPFRGREVS